MLKTAQPLLISLAEAGFQLGLPEGDVAALVHDGDLTAVKVRDQILIVYDSVTAFVRRVKRHAGEGAEF